MDSTTPSAFQATLPGSVADARLPATYGEVLDPLDVAGLPDPLAALHRDSALFRDWVQALDRTMRAEKVSSWTTWTEPERRAWDAGDVVGFSRLRGYTEAEISDYLAYLELTRRLDAGHPDDPDFSFCALHDVLRLVRTPGFDALEAQLRALSGDPPPRWEP
jgi:hypothetical protein